MCVLLVHHRLRADAPVVLLANRDEDYARPFAPPSLWPGPAGIVAPRDLLAGGTWIGVNRHGLVVAVTNRPAPTPRTDVRSRGRLVADALEHDGVPSASAWLKAHLRATDYAPFNLMLLDRREGVVLHHETRGADVVRMGPGVHVLTNHHDLDVAPVPACAEPRAGETLEALEARLERAAGDRETPMPGEHRMCKVGATRGTVCSAVLSLPADPSAPARMRFAPGPPHTTPFQTVRVG